MHDHDLSNDPYGDSLQIDAPVARRLNPQRRAAPYQLLTLAPYSQRILIRPPDVGSCSRGSFPHPTPGEVRDPAEASKAE